MFDVKKITNSKDTPVNMKKALINNFLIVAPKSREMLLSQLSDYKGILVALNAEKLLKKEKRLKDLVNQNLGYPDGVGAVWALRKKGYKTEKIPGAELWLDIIKKFHKYKSFYIIGGKEKIITETVKKLREEYPTINIKGFRNGFIKTAKEEQKLIEEITLQKPDIVFVAMGTPKQEYLMEKISEFRPALYMGLGGSLDVFTGQKKRAPILFQKLGLEWFYRLLLQPTRIKRQVVYLKFIWLLLFNKL